MVFYECFTEFHISFHERMAICDDSTDIVLGDAISNAVTLTSSVFKTAVENTPGIKHRHSI